MAISARRSGTVIWLAVALFVTSCGDAPERQADTTTDTSPGGRSTGSPRFDPAKIEAMKAQLRAEPKIKGVEFVGTHPDRPEWYVYVADDGTSRNGYAEYVCLLLREARLSDDDTDVWIADIDLTTSDHGGIPSLGHVRCSDGKALTP